MRVFGLTGGLASGKSTVAARFRALGVPVIDADQLAHEVVAKGTTGLAAVVEANGRPQEEHSQRAGTARNEASECHSRLPSDAMRRLLSRASTAPDLSMLETSANAGTSRSSVLRTVLLAPSSSGPK